VHHVCITPLREPVQSHPDRAAVSALDGERTRLCQSRQSPVLSVATDTKNPQLTIGQRDRPASLHEAFTVEQLQDDEPVGAVDQRPHPCQPRQRAGD
jgi:hypothetical protein